MVGGFKHCLFSSLFFFDPYLGKRSNLTCSYFSNGLVKNHQLEKPLGGQKPPFSEGWAWSLSGYPGSRSKECPGTVEVGWKKCTEKNQTTVRQKNPQKKSFTTIYSVYFGGNALFFFPTRLTKNMGATCRNVVLCVSCVCFFGGNPP